MTTQQAFDKFQIKAGENFETGKIALDRGRFVTIFNEAQNRLIEYILDKKSEDDIRYIQKILVSDFQISSSNKNTDSQEFLLPKNYFDFSNCFAAASKKDCKNQRMFLYEIKDDNKNEILQDEFNRPSFEAREAPFHIAQDNIKIYTSDFSVDKIYLSYYRYPQQIALLNEEDPESDFNSELNPEFDDKFTDRVISIAAGEFEINSENQKFQLDKQRALQKL